MPKYAEEIIYTYHRPVADAENVYPKIRDKAKELALLMRELCPPSRELSLARTKLEEVVMWANAAIARQPAYLKAIADGDPLEAALKERDRIAKVRAANPGAKNQTITYP